MIDIASNSIYGLYGWKNKVKNMITLMSYENYRKLDRYEPDSIRTHLWAKWNNHVIEERKKIGDFMDYIYSEVVFRDFDSARKARNMVADILAKGDNRVSIEDLKNNLKGDFDEKYFVIPGVDSEIDKEFYWNKKNVKIYEKEVDGQIFYVFEDPKAPDVV